MTGGVRVVTWGEFAASAPNLAEAGRGLRNQFGVGLAFLATVRADGAPRLHPVCPVLLDEHLYVFITPDSPKRYDLARDGRYALQTFPQPKPGSDEFYVAGRARLVMMRRCGTPCVAAPRTGRTRPRSSSSCNSIA